MRIGKRVAIDVGAVRNGMAVSDKDGILASPLATVASIEECIDLIDDSVIEIYVGLPLNLRGVATKSTARALKFAQALANSLSIPIRLIDERLTTALANTQLREVGKSQKEAKATVDQMAAVAILEFALLIERNTGAQPGKSLEELE